MITFRALCTVVLVAVGATSSWAVVETSCPAPCKKPPSTNVFVRELNGNFDAAGLIAPLTATLAHGKKHSVLRIDVMLLSTLTNNARGLFETVSVNSTSLAQQPIQACPTDQPCVLTATYWLELDAAEAASPGMFFKGPLQVNVSGGVININAGIGNHYEATLAVQLLKAN